MLYDFHSKVPTPTATGLFPLTGSDGKCCWRRTFFLFIVPFFPAPVLFTSRFPPPLLPFTGSDVKCCRKLTFIYLFFSRFKTLLVSRFAYFSFAPRPFAPDFPPTVPCPPPLPPSPLLTLSVWLWCWTDTRPGTQPDRPAVEGSALSQPQCFGCYSNHRTSTNTPGNP